MTFFKTFTPKKVSPAEIFPFFTRNFPMTFFSHYLPNQNFSPPNCFSENVLVAEFLYILTVSLKKVPVRHDLLYDTATLSHKIYIPHFHFSVRRTGAYRHKKPCSYLSIHISYKSCYLWKMTRYISLNFFNMLRNHLLM